jgi:APA family basic amino acid/polyamine antiporter
MMMMKNSPDASSLPEQIRYSKRFNHWQAILRGFGVMIILSAFILIGQTASITGRWAPLSFFLAILLLAPNILTYAELAVSVPCTGGAYVQVHESRDGWLAFLTGWVLVIATLSIGALLAQAFADQVAALLQDHFNLTITAWPWALGLVIV